MSRQELNDAELDGLLERELTRRLDGRLGRAVAAFEVHQASLGKRMMWRWVTAGLAVAALVGVAIVIVEAMLGGNGPSKLADPVAKGSDPSNLAMTRTVAWRDLDEGTVLLDEHTPVRRVRRQVMETSRWFDPARQSLLELSEPREEYVLIGLSKQ